MGHLPDLIRDLAMILIAGAFTTLLFRKIRQPLVLGYIIVGFLVGPHFNLFPSVADTANIEILAEIGVIFLLFSLGLEFSFKKLMRVGGEASVTAFVEIAFITIAGYLTGKWMGWSTMDSLFLGGMLASSSTTIILRAFDELGVKTKQYARIVFGVLVVEDIVVILLMVLLSTMAVTREFEGTEILFTVLKLGFFLALWFITGIFLLPTLLKHARTLIDDEALLILSLGLCLGMVVLATQVGFSAELGAFIMGSIIAETTSAEKVEHLIKPVKDLFGTVFFVSVGMMIDPNAIVEYACPVVLVTLLTLFGKLLSTTAGALLSGQPLRQSVQVGMSMAQIGEFAFIVATLGLSLGVISDFLFPVAVGASAVTTFITPYLIRFSDPVAAWTERVLPERLLGRLNRYAAGTQKIQAEGDWRIALKAYVQLIVTNSIFLIAVTIFAINFLLPWLDNKLGLSLFQDILAFVLVIGLASPFLWGLMAKRPNKMAYRELWIQKIYSRGPLFILELVRIVIGLLFIALWVFTLFAMETALFIVLPAILVTLVLFANRIRNFYQRLESRFLDNLHERESIAYHSLDETVKRKKKDIESYLTPWDAHIVALETPPHAGYVGRTLIELGWREKFGINIVYIKRGDQLIHVPARNQTLLPFDQVGVLATDVQLQSFLPVFNNVESIPVAEIDIDNIVLDRVTVDEHNQLKGQDIRSSGIREKTQGLVIGIERTNQRLLNPDSTTVFEWGDVVWIVGDRNRIKELKQST